MRNSHVVTDNKIGSGVKLPKFFDWVWGLSLFVYIVCSLTFISLSELHFVATLSQMLFLGVSIFSIIVRFSMKFDGYVISCLVFAVIMVFGTYYTQAYQTSMEILYSYCLSAFTVVCVYNYITTEERFEFFLKCMMLAGLSLCVYLFFIYGWNMFALAVSDEEYFRLGEEIGNANNIGITTAMSVFIAAGFILCKKESFLHRVPELLCIAVCGTFSLMSASKKVIIILLSIVLILFLKRGNNRNIFRKIRYIVLAALLVALLVYLLENVELFHTINRRVQLFLESLKGVEDTSVSEQERNYFISEGLRLFWKSPIVGNGTNSSAYFFGVYTHCNYIELLLNHGIVGFTVYYYPYAVALLYFIDGYFFKNDKNAMSVFAFVLLLLIMALGAGLVYYYDRQAVLIFAAVFAYIKLSKKNEKKVLQEVQSIESKENS